MGKHPSTGPKSRLFRRLPHKGDSTMGNYVDLNTEQGEPARAYLSLPSSGKGPGVLLMHAWWGLNDFQVQLADRLAEEGFVVLAPDLYGGQVASTIPEAERLGGALDANGDYGLQV